MLLLALGFTAWQAMTVRSSLTAASERLSSTVDALGDGNFDAAATELDQARDTAGTARRHSRGPVWWAASKLPVIGDDVAAVRVISEVTDSLASRSLPDLVEAAKRFGPEQITPRGGRVDLEPVARVAPILAEGAQQIASADARVAELDPAGLVGALAGPVTDLQSKLARAARVSSVAATAAELMPAMLGSEGDRRYFLVFPNNAEIRAGGGMLGAHAVMQVRNGKPRIIEQGTPASLGPFTEDFIDLSADERKLFTTRLSVHPQNAAFLPDFPRTAQILTQMWEARRDADLDGMVSVDPVAMSYLLRATGPIALSNGQELTADNAVDYLLHGVYQSVPDGDTQNELYEEAARLVFEALLSDGVEPRTLLDALTQAVNEGRIKIWAADQREQQRLAGTTVAAELPVADGSVPEIGVYLNDAAADKLSYFLDYHVDVTPLTCSPRGSFQSPVR